MGRVVITTKTCPCCKYKYETTEIYEITEEESNSGEEKCILRKVTLGNENFTSITVDQTYGVAAMECPNCGIYMNAGKCTKVVEESF